MMEVDGTDTAQDDSPKRILCFWGGEAGFEKLDYLIVNFGHFFATQLACAGFGGFVCGSGQTLEAVGVGFKTKEGLEIVWIFEGSAVGAIGAVLAERGKSDGGLHDGGNDGQVCGGFGYRPSVGLDENQVGRDIWEFYTEGEEQLHAYLPYLLTSGLRYASAPPSPVFHMEVLDGGLGWISGVTNHFAAFKRRQLPF